MPSILKNSIRKHLTEKLGIIISMYEDGKWTMQISASLKLAKSTTTFFYLLS